MDRLKTELQTLINTPFIRSSRLTEEINKVYNKYKQTTPLSTEDAEEILGLCKQLEEKNTRLSSSGLSCIWNKAFPPEESSLQNLERSIISQGTSAASYKKEYFEKALEALRAPQTNINQITKNLNKLCAQKDFLQSYQKFLSLIATCQEKKISLPEYVFNDPENIEWIKTNIKNLTLHIRSKETLRILKYQLKESTKALNDCCYNTILKNLKDHRFPAIEQALNNRSYSQKDKQKILMQMHRISRLHLSDSDKELIDKKLSPSSSWFSLKKTPLTPDHICKVLDDTFTKLTSINSVSTNTIKEALTTTLHQESFKLSLAFFLEERFIDPGSYKNIIDILSQNRPEILQACETVFIDFHDAPIETRQDILSYLNNTIETLPANSTENEALISALYDTEFGLIPSKASPELTEVLNEAKSSLTKYYDDFDETPEILLSTPIWQTLVMAIEQLLPENQKIIIDTCVSIIKDSKENLQITRDRLYKTITEVDFSKISAKEIKNTGSWEQLGETNLDEQRNITL
jgi:hypothetical protein